MLVLLTVTYSYFVFQEVIFLYFLPFKCELLEGNNRRDACLVFMLLIAPVGRREVSDVLGQWFHGAVLHCGDSSSLLCSVELKFKKTHSQFWGQRSEVNPQTGFMSADG